MPAFDGLPDCPSCHGSGILYDWVPYGMGNARMPIDCYCITEQAEAWREAQDALRDEFDDLKAQRNALAAQVDDLRNVNAGLRKDNERLRTVYETDNARLRNALEEVEWCDGACPWCHGRPRGLGHSVACHRQAALR